MTPPPATSSTDSELRQPETDKPRGARLWFFRLAAAVLIPALFLLTVELGMRLASYGYATAFIVPVAGRDDVVTTNPRFGWRFFPRLLARSPVPLEIPEERHDAFRIFVTGGSAARGTPDSAYAFGRMLEVLLEQAYPDSRFEVHNAAMTAINSHVVREVVRDCAAQGSDLFVVYLGNNEVVGPYGAGTVFGEFSPNLAAIRAALALKSTRFGQGLEAALGGAHRDNRQAEWRGMEMFLEQRVAADDPRLEEVYEHFRRNLVDIVRTAHRNRAQTLLVTVATNLRDQPPFASLHRRDLSDQDAERWLALYRLGIQAAEADDPAAALTHWRQAERLDGQHAELQFQIGRAMLMLGQPAEATRYLIRARDLDALRFRADTRINEILRQVAMTETERRVTLVDADRLFVAGGEGVPALPGRRFFHEHVHLTFAGNLALANAVFEHVANRLPKTYIRDPSVVMPNASEMADRLAFTAFDHAELEADILRIVSRPPFTGQFGNAEDVASRWDDLARLRSELDRQAWEKARLSYRHRLQEDPDDLELRRRFASLLLRRDPAQSIEHWRLLLERLPEVASWRASLATALTDAGQSEEALAELDLLRNLEGESAGWHVNRGTVFERQQRYDEADQAYRRALQQQPRHTLARFNLATSALRRGEVAQAAELFQDLLSDRSDFAPAHHSLGRCLEQLDQPTAAADSYRRAIEADPGLAAAHNSLGLLLEKQQSLAAAASSYRRALAFQPDHALAHFNLADLLLGLGEAVEATRLYRKGLTLRPDNTQGRYNHAQALANLGEDAAAVRELDLVLEARPEDPATLHNLAWILATTDVVGVRDPLRAVEIARRAVEATDGSAAEILETLAVAYVANGRLGDATAALERALQVARSQGRAALTLRLEQRLSELR